MRRPYSLVPSLDLTGTSSPHLSWKITSRRLSETMSRTRGQLRLSMSYWLGENSRFLAFSASSTSVTAWVSDARLA